VDPGRDHSSAHALSRDIGDRRDQPAVVDEHIVGVTGDLPAWNRAGGESESRKIRELLGMEVGLYFGSNFELPFEALSLEGLLSQPRKLHGHRDLNRKQLNEANVVSGKRLSTGPRFLVGRNQHAKGAVVRLQRQGQYIVGVEPLGPCLIELILIENRGPEMPGNLGVLGTVAKVDLGRSHTHEGDKVIDEFLSEPRHFENSADIGGDGSDGFQLPEVKPLIEAGSLEFVPQRCSLQTDANGTKHTLVKTTRPKKCQDPRVLVRPEGNVGPALGGLFHLMGHRSRPPRSGFAPPTEDARPGAGFLDHCSQEIFKELRIGVSGQGKLCKLEQITRRHGLRALPGRSIGPGRSWRTGRGP